jgi:hypothetical protein
LTERLPARYTAFTRFRVHLRASHAAILHPSWPLPRLLTGHRQLAASDINSAKARRPLDVYLARLPWHDAAHTSPVCQMRPLTPCRSPDGARNHAGIARSYPSASATYPYPYLVGSRLPQPLTSCPYPYLVPGSRTRLPQARIVPVCICFKLTRCRPYLARNPSA